MDSGSGSINAAAAEPIEGAGVEELDDVLGIKTAWVFATRFD